MRAMHDNNLYHNAVSAQTVLVVAGRGRLIGFASASPEVGSESADQRAALVAFLERIYLVPDLVPFLQHLTIASLLPPADVDQSVPRELPTTGELENNLRLARLLFPGSKHELDSALATYPASLGDRPVMRRSDRAAPDVSPHGWMLLHLVAVALFGGLLELAEEAGVEPGQVDWAEELQWYQSGRYDADPSHTRTHRIQAWIQTK
jgi:hypothetical protein